MRYRRSNDNLFFIIFGVSFTAAGLFSAIFFGQTSTLTCQRLESVVVDCLLQRDLLGLPISETDVGQIETAWVEVNVDSDGDTYRVVLQGPEDAVPLTSFYSSSYADKQETADTINGFLVNPAQTSLQIEQSEWWVFLLAGLFAIIGIASGGWGIFRAVTGVFPK